MTSQALQFNFRPPRGDNYLELYSDLFTQNLTRLSKDEIGE
jgi:hypothetical protein